MSQCYKCQSANVISGKFDLAGAQRGFLSMVVFKPDRKVRFLATFVREGVVCGDTAFACMDCGHVWSSVDPQELNHYVTECCKPPKTEE